MARRLARRKPRVLVIETGGTIGQKKGKDGVHRPTGESVTKKVKGLYRLAKIEVDMLERQIDSTNMLTRERLEIAQRIYGNAFDFDGFVVIQGTDTTVQTAAALTFMIQGLGKPIVVVGSQRSIYEHRTDARNNVLAAIEAATMDFGEVMIVFGDHILRGPRSIKDDEEGNNAFLSPRCPPIGKVGIHIMAFENRIKRHEAEVRLFTNFDTEIGFFYPASGASSNTFDMQIEHQSVHGMVFVGFGAGNIPEQYYPGLEIARRLNKPIVCVTECNKGAADMGIYEVGSIPLDMGVISGEDMTMHTATQKLMYALGRATEEGVSSERRIEFVQRIIRTNYAEEINLDRFGK